MEAREAQMNRLLCAAVVAVFLALSPVATAPAMASSPIFGKANVVEMSTDQNKHVTGKYAGSPYAYYGYLYSYYSMVYNLYHYYYGSNYAYGAYYWAYNAYVMSYYAYYGY
jgi:hypothetical protein